MIQYDFNKLRGRIKEICKTQENFAQKLNISSNTLSDKLNNQRYFTSEEISNAIDILEINDPTTAWNIFFTKQVENISTKVE